MSTKLKFYTQREVAELLRVSVRTVTRLIMDKRLRAVKVGGVWRVAETDLLEYLRNCEPRSFLSANVLSRQE